MEASNSLIKTLIDCGLSRKEAVVYVSLLELEIARVNEIARKTKINRSSTYVVLDSLKEKGLVATSNDGSGIQEFIASPPDLLLQSAKESATRQQSIKNNLEEVVPELKALHKDTKHRPKVRVYEGVNGVKELYYHLLSSNYDELRTYSNPENIFKIMPNFNEHNSERMKKKIKMFAINPHLKSNVDMLEHFPKKSPDQVLLIPRENFKLSSDLGIYGNMVSFVSPLEEFGVLIENKEFAEIMKNIFDLSWEEAKRINRDKKLPNRLLK